MNWLVWGAALVLLILFMAVVGGLTQTGLLTRFLTGLRHQHQHQHFFRKSVVRPALLIILIVRNQEQIIEGVIRRLRWLNNWLPGSFGLIVIDNVSQDRTTAILERLWRQQRDFSYYPLDEVLDHRDYSAVMASLESGAGPAGTTEVTAAMSQFVGPGALGQSYLCPFIPPQRPGVHLLELQGVADPQQFKAIKQQVWHILNAS